MQSLARLSLKNRALIALVTIVASIFGFIGVGSLKQELMPSVQFPAVVVITQYPGASPEVVNNDVSSTIETALRSVPGLESTTATSSTGMSMVLAEFTYGTDNSVTEQRVERAISRVSQMLPEGLEPSVMSGSLDDMPVVQAAVIPGEGNDAEQTADLVERVAIPELDQLDGVREAVLSGSLGERVTITPDDDELEGESLTRQSITDALQQSGVLMAAGSITEDGQTLAVQAGENLESVEQIEDLPLVRDPGLMQARAAEEAAEAAAEAEAAAAEEAAAAGAAGMAGGAAPLAPQTAPPAAAEPEDLPVITIGDVAEVSLEPNPRESYSRVDGQPALTIAITKMSTANTVEVSQAVRAALADLEPSLDGATFEVVFDQAPYIEQSIETLATEGLLGLIFAIIVILVFLLSVRATLVTAISIPVSVLFTFVGLNFAEYTLNMLTLSALTISIGRVVDDSIVVIENIKRHLGDSQPGDDRASIIVNAVREVGGAITASTLTSAAVFLPMAFVGDMVGEMFRPFAFTAAIALGASLLVALTIVPVLAYWFLRDGTPAGFARDKRKVEKRAAAGKPVRDRHGRGVAATQRVDIASGVAHGDSPPSAAGGDEATAMQRGYLPIVKWTLKRPIVTLLAAVVVFGGTMAATPLMKTNFMGSDEQNSVGLVQTLQPGVSLDEQLAQVERVEEALATVPEVETVQVTIGGGSSGMEAIFGGSSDGAINYSITTDEDATQAEVQDDIRAAVGELDEAGDFSIGMSDGGMTMSSAIEVVITAPDQETLAEASDEVATALRDQDGLIQVETDLAASRPYLSIVVDREKAADVGLTEAAVAGQVAAEMSPQQIGQITLDNTNVRIYLSAGEAPETEKGVEALKIQTADGEKKLSSLATVEVADGPVTVRTQDNARITTVSALPEGDDLGTAGVAVDTALAAVDLPPGATANIGGVMSQQADAFEQLGIALLVAILIVYVIMVATFRSLLQPLLLLISVPFAATGALLLLIATGIPLGVAGIIGLLMLIGIVVTNAIVLIDLVNQQRDQGRPLYDAVVSGASLRLRPIVMTALATIFALMPMGIGITGHGGFISQPLAVVVIGGLLSSTVLTLIVLPTLYYVVERRRERSRERRAARREKKFGPTAGAATAVAHGAQRGQTPVVHPDEPPTTTGSHGIITPESYTKAPDAAASEPPTTTGSHGIIRPDGDKPEAQGS